MSIAGGFFGGGSGSRKEEDDTKGSGAAAPEPWEAIQVDLDSGVLALPPTPRAGEADDDPDGEAPAGDQP
jgi:hypothetical protein